MLLTIFVFINTILFSQINIEVFSVTDQVYRKELQEELKRAKKENNYQNIAIIEYILRQENDPPMYHIFTEAVKTKVQNWIKNERKIFNNTSIIFSPFSTGPLSPGEIRVTVIEKNDEKKEIKIKATGIKISNGIEYGFEQVKSLLQIDIKKQKAIPTNRKIASAVPKNGAAFSFI